MAVFPGVGAAAKAAAKAAKYGECPQGRKTWDCGLPSGPWSQPRPLLGLGDLSSLRLNGLGLRPPVDTSLPPPQTCLSDHSAWPCLLFFTDWPSNGGPLWSIWLLPPYSQGQPIATAPPAWVLVVCSEFALDIDHVLPTHRPKPLELQRQCQPTWDPGLRTCHPHSSPEPCPYRPFKVPTGFRPE